MNHPFLHLFDQGSHQLPQCYDQLHAWLKELPSWFANEQVPPPKATLLCGIPGSGKALVTKVIGRALNRPLYRIDPACDAFALTEILGLFFANTKQCILWIDRPSELHLGVVRWLLDQPRPPVFVVFTTDEPYKLPVDYLRADLVESVWHLDTLNRRERSAIWRVTVPNGDNPSVAIDQVRLAQASALFTLGEIQAVAERSQRKHHGKGLGNNEVLDEIFAIRPLAHECDEQLARMRDWATLRAKPAMSQGTRHDDDD